MANDKPINSEAGYVLYWMIAARRSRSNFALDRAMAWAVELGLPVVVLEALSVDYEFASDRLHRFVIDGMADNLRSFNRSEILYYPYVEPTLGAARGLLERFARGAALVVTDDYPCFFLPRAVAAASDRVGVRMWGKKILEWSASPRQAFETMIALMNRWALDGRDPNSYAGYAWTLGRYDRPWPERPIYGTVRSMSSDNAARKLHLSRYLGGRPEVGAVEG